jgi:hypothetical protein
MFESYLRSLSISYRSRLRDSRSLPLSIARQSCFRFSPPDLGVDNLVQGNAEEVSLELSCAVSIRVGIETRRNLLLGDHLNSIEFLV